MKITLSILFSVFLVSLSAQEIPPREIYIKLDEGEAFMKSGKYEEANQALLFVLGNLKPLPPKVAYLFGRNSYHLGQYKQSINWLNKYIQLQGTGGAYYDQAVSFLNRSEEQYMKIQRANSVENSLSTESLYDCGGLEKMICPVCKGEGVVIKKGAFGNTYQTCPYSKGLSYLSCEDYNLFMMGKLALPTN